jgi:hypothetical protein
MTIVRLHHSVEGQFMEISVISSVPFLGTHLVHPLFIKHCEVKLSALPDAEWRDERIGAPTA